MAHRRWWYLHLCKQEVVLIIHQEYIIKFCNMTNYPHWAMPNLLCFVTDIVPMSAVYKFFVCAIMLRMLFFLVSRCLTRSVDRQWWIQKVIWRICSPCCPHMEETSSKTLCRTGDIGNITKNKFNVNWNHCNIDCS